MRAFDALIVGAGPAGSATAIVLARAGWSVALLEKEGFPRRKVCGECIAASNLSVFDDLGVASAVQNAAGPALREVMLMRGADCVRAPLPPAAQAGSRWGRALGRETLDGLLLDAAARAGARVTQPCHVDRWERRGAFWHCFARGAQGTYSAPVMIDAHGSWSTPRPLPRAQASDLFAFKANFRGASVMPGSLPVLCFRGGYGGMVLADGDITTVACCVRRDRLALWRARHRGAAAGDTVEAMLRAQCAGVDAALRGATRIGAWLAVGPIAPGIRVRDGDTLLRVGNAAGEAHPILGEGISMALQSGVLLARQLVARPPVVGALETWQRGTARSYAQAWRQAFARRHRIAALFAHAAMHDASSAALLAIVRRVPAVMAVGARWSGKTQAAC